MCNDVWFFTSKLYVQLRLENTHNALIAFYNQKQPCYESELLVVKQYDTSYECYITCTCILPYHNCLAQPYMNM